MQRNLEGIVPLNVPHKSKLLFINVINNRQKKEATGHEFDVMKEVFVREGYTVDVLTTPSHREIEKRIEDYEAVLINYRLDVDTYHGGTLRPGWDNIFHFWRGYIFNAKRLICTSFGDPYKLYDMPFLKTYLNAYCDTPECQRAAAGVILGKLPALGKNPVALEGFFEREV
jgi:beta-N-acetylhexosaminidase